MLIKFCNSYVKKWLKDNDIKTYSAYNEGKSVVTERFIRTPKSKIYRHITVVSKNVYSDMLVTYNTIKMKPIDIKSSSYGEYNVDSNDKDTKFKVCNYVRISKYNNIFAKRYARNWSEKVPVISKIKNTVPWTYVINDLSGKEIIETFMKKNCRRKIKNNL